MKKYFLFFVFSIFFLSCSFSPPPNQWRNDAARSYNLYIKHFLQNKIIPAKEDLQRAKDAVKMGGDISLLATITLGACAIETPFGINTNCQEFQRLLPLIHDQKLSNYYQFIMKKNTNYTLLPNNYKNFAKTLEENDYQTANTLTLKEENPSSKLIMIYLLGEKALPTTLQNAQEVFAQYGYKKALIYALELLAQKEPQKASIIQKKITILQSK